MAREQPREGDSENQEPRWRSPSQLPAGTSDKAGDDLRLGHFAVAAMAMRATSLLESFERLADLL